MRFCIGFALAAFTLVARADAQATLTRAKAQAEANRTLAQSLTAELIDYQQIQRWDGKLPRYTGTPRVSATQTSSGTALR